MCGSRSSSDADVVAAGFVDEVVEIVEGAIGRVDGLRVGGVGLDGGEEEAVDAEGLDVVETLGDAVETAAAVGAEVDRIDFVDDGMFPPDVGIDAGADPAGAGEGLRRAGEVSAQARARERARSRRRVGVVIALVDEMLRESMAGWSVLRRWAQLERHGLSPAGAGLYFCHREEHRMGAPYACCRCGPAALPDREWGCAGDDR